MNVHIDTEAHVDKLYGPKVRLLYDSSLFLNQSTRLEALGPRERTPAVKRSLQYAWTSERS